MKLSIITINLNNAEGLSKTIQSVLKQTFTDYEYIVIDGASTDGSREIINGNEGFLKYSVSEQDSGVYNAMNKGIIKAEGEYCLFLNSGDFLYNENVLSLFFSNNITEDIVLCKGIPYSKKNRKKTPFSSIVQSEITFDDIYQNALNHQSTFIKTKLFHQYGLYDERYKIISDRIFFIKTLGLSNVSFRYLDFIISRYDIDGISNDVTNYFNAELMPAFKELIPPRILMDYESGYINIIKQLKKNKISWFLFRVLAKITSKIDSYIKKNLNFFNF